MAAPERCPTCDTVVPAGAQRCPGCGRVFGEENRCPHCHAVAAVLPRGGRTVCAACGKPRAGVQLGDGGGGGKGQAERTTAMMRRARGRGQRAFGVLSLGAGVLTAAALAMLVPGGLGYAIAAIGGLLGVGIGALSVRSGARNMEEARRAERRAQQLDLIELARESGGRLTAAEAAEALQVSVEEADTRLTEMIGDGSRVDVDVDEDGVLRYEFRDLTPPKVRVEPPSEAPEALEEPVEVATRTRGAERERER